MKNSSSTAESCRFRNPKIKLAHYRVAAKFRNRASLRVGYRACVDSRGLIGTRSTRSTTWRPGGAQDYAEVDTPPVVSRARKIRANFARCRHAIEPRNRVSACRASAQIGMASSESFHAAARKIRTPDAGCMDARRGRLPPLQNRRKETELCHQSSLPRRVGNPPPAGFSTEQIRPVFSVRGVASASGHVL
jgi:hypothetical protein